MTNDELKKKIVKILANCKCEECAVEYCADCEGNPSIEHCREKQQADALIAAGIGDVEDVEAEANRYEMLYKLQNRDMALAERRAHDVEIVQKIAASATAMAVLEAAKAEHRAEVAERALNKFAENVTCEDCPFFSDCSSLEKMKDSVHSNYCFAEYLRQAEKELVEEGKDD